MPYLYCRIACPVGLNCDQMEEGEQYNEYSVERNPRAYMSMRDYRNLPWQNQQPLGRNPNPNRSMRDYRDQWMSAPVYSVPSTYAPPASPYFTLTPQPQQPPQLTSSVEQAILNLSKLVDNFKEEQRAVNVQANQEINIVESSLNKELDGFQSEIDKKIDILQESISKLTNQLVHQEEENPRKECLIDTTVEEQYKQQDEAIPPLLTEESSGKDVVEGTQEPILQPIPINLDPNAIVQPKDNPLLAASSPYPVYTLPAAQFTPATQFTPEALAPKAHASPSLLVQNIRKLVATILAFATTSKTLAAADVAWHNRWFGCWFGFGALEPRNF